MRMTWMVVGVLALAGCITREEQIAGFRAQCQQEYGLTPGTDAFGACVQNADMARRRAISGALNAPLPTPAPAPIFVPVVR